MWKIRRRIGERARKVGSEARAHKCCRAFQVHDHHGTRTEDEEVGGSREQEREQKWEPGTGDEGRGKRDIATNRG